MEMEQPSWDQRRNVRRVELQLKTEASLLQGWALLPIDYYVLSLVVLCHGIPSGL